MRLTGPCVHPPPPTHTPTPRPLTLCPLSLPAAQQCAAAWRVQGGADPPRPRRLHGQRLFHALRAPHPRRPHGEGGWVWGMGAWWCVGSASCTSRSRHPLPPHTRAPNPLPPLAISSTGTPRARTASACAWASSSTTTWTATTLRSWWTPSPASPSTFSARCARACTMTRCARAAAAAAGGRAGGGGGCWSGSGIAFPHATPPPHTHTLATRAGARMDHQRGRGDHRQEAGEQPRGQGGV